jgi:hypothetical protein
MPDSNNATSEGSNQDEKTILEILHPFTNAPGSPLQKIGNTYYYGLYEGVGIPKSHVVKFQLIVRESENADVVILPQNGCFLSDEGYMVVARKGPEENPIIHAI